MGNSENPSDRSDSERVERFIDYALKVALQLGRGETKSILIPGKIPDGELSHVRIAIMGIEIQTLIDRYHREDDPTWKLQYSFDATTHSFVIKRPRS